MPDVPPDSGNSGDGENEENSGNEESGYSYTLRVVPKSRRGFPLRGALVSYLPPGGDSGGALGTMQGDWQHDTYDGNVAAQFDAAGNSESPGGKIRVRHYGEAVADVDVGDSNPEKTGTDVYKLVLEAGESRAPEELTMDKAEWIDNEFVITWRPPRNTPPRSIQAAIYNPDLVGEDPIQEIKDADVDTSVFLRHENKRADNSKSGVYGSDVFYRNGWERQKAYLFGEYSGSFSSFVRNFISWTEQGEKKYLRLEPRDWFSTHGGKMIVRDGGSRAKPEGVDGGDGPEPVEFSKVETFLANSKPTDTGSNVTGVTVSPSSGFIEGDAYILTASVSGDGNHDRTVSWSASGIEIITYDGQHALIKAGSSGDVTATSNGDSSYSDTVNVNPSPYPYNQTPQKPSSVEWASESPSGTVYISWDPPQNGLVFHRIYLSENSEDVSSSPHAEIFGSEISIGDLQVGKKYHAEIARVHPDGNESDHVSLSFTPQEVAGKRSGHLVDGLPEIIVSPGSTASIDLSNYIHLNKLPSDSTQSEAWNNVEVETVRPSTGNEISVSKSLPTVSISADGGASTDYGPEPIFLRIRYGVRRVLWVGLFVRTGSSNGEGVRQINGVSAADLPEEAGFDASRLVGANASAKDLNTWMPEIQQAAKMGSVSVDEDGQGVLNTDVSEGTAPLVSAVEGDDGAALIVLSRRSDPAPSLPQLPSGEAEKAEQDGSYTRVPSGFPETLSSSLDAKNWNRVKTSSKLYDVSLLEPPREVRFQPPEYYRDVWLDEDKYPEDAELLADAGAVQYRGGLQTDSASPKDPSVSSLSADSAPSGAEVDWEISLDGETRNDLSVPFDVYEQGSPGSARTLYGTGHREVDGLDPATTYVIDLFGTQKTVDPDRHPVFLTVTGSAVSGGEYKYRYSLSGESVSDIDSWTDSFGNSHSGSEATVTSADVISEHKIVATWPNEAREVRAETDWRAPATNIEYKETARVGRSLPVQQQDQPEFRARQFDGSRTRQLPYNTYPKGTWTVYPIGYVPLGVGGELSDYVTAEFIDPKGEAIGDTAELGRTAELAVKIEVRASDSRSPIVYGVRATRTS